MEKVRMQFDFAPVAAERLDHLVELSGAASRAEVVRRALALYDRVIAIQQAGAELRVVQDGRPDVVLAIV